MLHQAAEPEFHKDRSPNEYQKVKVIGVVPQAVETPATQSGTARTPLQLRELVSGKVHIEAGEATPQLEPFHRQYDSLSPYLKARCTWEGPKGMKARLLANDSKYLKKVVEMRGQLFGIDEKGNPLFVDIKMDVSTKGKTSAEAKAYIEQKGYEMFTAHRVGESYAKGSELAMYEEQLRRDFIGDPQTPSWLHIENGKPDTSAYIRIKFPERKQEITETSAEERNPSIGVTRLLRVKDEIL